MSQVVKTPATPVFQEGINIDAISSKDFHAANYRAQGWMNDMVTRVGENPDEMDASQINPFQTDHNDAFKVCLSVMLSKTHSKNKALGRQRRIVASNVSVVLFALCIRIILTLPTT